MADLLLFITSWIALIIFFFFFNDTATTEIYTLSLHDALPISFQGEQDLDKKLIRSVGDPNWRFQEDYLRILRALRSEEHTSELQSQSNLVCRLLLEKKKKISNLTCFDATFEEMPGLHVDEHAQ